MVIVWYWLKLKWLNLTSILFVSHINLLSFQFQLENIDSKIKSLKLYNLIASHNKTLQIEPLRQWPFKSSVQVSWIFHNYFSMYGTILRLIIRVLTWSSTRKILEVDAHGWDIYLISVSWTKTTKKKYACWKFDWYYNIIFVELTLIMCAQGGTRVSSSFWLLVPSTVPLFYR
jgi:hypothetical protein